MPNRNHKSLTDQIREAIDGSGLSRYRISQESGIDQAGLARLYNEGRGSLAMLNRLAACLQLRVSMDRQPTTEGTRPTRKQPTK
ncbi:MAG TPA: hypothetical protein VFE24_13575 [Pirellulales bacterium]|jgi:hypothetical protein|nr:hypothetical protein [Pirellulales bacterium]